MVIKTGCQCFTCRHSDEPRLIAAYEQGIAEACDWVLNWAKRNNLKSGSVADDDLPGLIATLEYNRMASSCYIKEMPDIESDTNE